MGTGRNRNVKPLDEEKTIGETFPELHEKLMKVRAWNESVYARAKGPQKRSKKRKGKRK